ILNDDGCIDFTMIITSRNNAPISNFGGDIRCKSEYPWCIIEILSGAMNVLILQCCVFFCLCTRERVEIVLQTLGLVSDSKMNLVGALGRSFFEIAKNFQKRREKPEKN
ncbi:Uncharacterized protein FWK35_00020166, partial [Aphis craccivora]